LSYEKNFGGVEKLLDGCDTLRYQFAHASELGAKITREFQGLL
jgi:hypothetical protein